MAAKEYLLTLPTLMGETIRLAQPCPVDRDDHGKPVFFDSLDPRSFGRSFLAATGPATVWHARTEVESLDQLDDLYGFQSGAIVSPRARAIIESRGIPRIEFIPLKIYRDDSDVPLGTWHFLNVFNWRRPFDLVRSRVRYADFYQPVTGTRQISRRFGDRAIAEWDVLEINWREMEDDLLIAEAPSERIWCNVFISERLAHTLNHGLPSDRQITFHRFWLDRGPDPKFDTRGYRYAGRPAPGWLSKFVARLR
ncbi:MAG TPA: hypothetical protein VI168_12825 [Croceibacterium sp.]